MNKISIIVSTVVHHQHLNCHGSQLRGQRQRHCRLLSVIVIVATRVVVISIVAKGGCFFIRVGVISIVVGIIVLRIFVVMEGSSSGAEILSFVLHNQSLPLSVIFFVVI